MQDGTIRHRNGDRGWVLVVWVQSKTLKSPVISENEWTACLQPIRTIQLILCEINYRTLSSGSERRTLL